MLEPAVKSGHTLQMPRIRRRWPWIVGILFIVWIGALCAVWIAVTHAEPILRARVSKRCPRVSKPKLSWQNCTFLPEMALKSMAAD